MKQNQAYFTENIETDLAMNEREIENLYAIETAEDIRREKEMAREQRMESLGTLAGGIAQDFNSLLGVLLLHLSLLEKQIEDPPRRNATLEILKKTVFRGRDLVRQLLTFAHVTEMDLQPLEPGDVVKKILVHLNETFPGCILVETLMDPTLPVVHGDGAQIHLALLNFCLNARDAILPGGGKLGIAVRRVTGKWLNTFTTRARAIEYVEFSVSDEGRGMDEVTQSKLFEPFFSTKDRSNAPGMGLSIVYAIVQRHEGFVRVESAAGEGARFAFYLPVVIESPLL